MLSSPILIKMCFTAGVVSETGLPDFRFSRTLNRYNRWTQKRKPMFSGMAGTARGARTLRISARPILRPPIARALRPDRIYKIKPHPVNLVNPVHFLNGVFFSFQTPLGSGGLSRFLRSKNTRQPFLKRIPNSWGLRPIGANLTASHDKKRLWMRLSLPFPGRVAQVSNEIAQVVFDRL